jgi:hypothetical protein
MQNALDGHLLFVNAKPINALTDKCVRQKRHLRAFQCVSCHMPTKTIWWCTTAVTGAIDAERQLDQLILDKNQPAIARASALPLLEHYISLASEPAIKATIVDPDPMVRMVAAQAMPLSPPRAMIEAILPLLSDPIRAVRVGTARVIGATRRIFQRLPGTG